MIVIVKETRTVIMKIDYLTGVYVCGDGCDNTIYLYILLLSN